MCPLSPAMQRTATMADIPRMVVMSLNRRRTWVVSGGGVLLVDRRFLERGRVSKPTASLPARNNDELANKSEARTQHCFAFMVSKVRLLGGHVQGVKGRQYAKVWHTDAMLLARALLLVLICLSHGGSGHRSLDTKRVWCPLGEQNQGFAQVPP